MPNLPVPTWAQEVPGNFITSALWNSNVFNGGTFLTSPPLFVGYQNTVQSIPNNTWTPAALDVTTVDTYAGHSNTTNNSRYTAQTGAPGWYTVCGVVAYSANATGFRTARIQVNGLPLLGGAAYLSNNATVETGVITPTRDVFLNVGDYVEVAGYQSSGAALSTILDVDLRCALWVRFSHS